MPDSGVPSDRAPQTRNRALLTLLSALQSDDEMAASIPCRADRSLQRGTPVSQRSGAGPRRHSVLMFESRVAREASAEAHVVDLLERLRPAAAAIRAFADRARTEEPATRACVLSISVQTEDEMTGFELSPAVITRVGEIGAVLSVSWYVYDFEDSGD